MNISTVFIKKPIMTVLVFLCVVIFGIAAYFNLPISDLPEVQSPVITINASLPGASPNTMASAVASPLENQCMQIPGLESIISTNTEGSTQITLTFSLDKNVDLVAPDVQAAISRASANLPTLPNPPSYQKFNPSDAPILYILVTSETMNSGELYDIANKRVAQRISMINGVSEVDCYGAKTAEVIKLDPLKLAAYDIGISDVSIALQSSTPMIPGGSINGKSRAYSVEPDGQLTDESQYNNLIVKYAAGGPVRISDIGKATNSTDNEDINIVYYKKGVGERMMPAFIMVRRTGDSNTIDLSNNIKKLIESIKDEIPGSVNINVLYDRAETILDSINDVKFTLLLAFILVVIVIFIFIGRVSDTVIPAVSLPLSIIATFLVMMMASFTLDNLSLMALTLAVGFVVDDAIVVLENTVRLIEEGLSPFDAAIKSAKEITGTVVSMTLSLVTVFVPLVYMGGIVGRTFREFALTVILAVVCSGIISLTLSPMMCARILKPIEKEHKGFSLKKKVDFFIRKLVTGYALILRFVLKRKYISLVVWLICIVGTVWFYSIVPKGFMPVGDSGVIQGGILAPLGTSTPMMHEFQKAINQTLENNPFVNTFVTLTGMSNGADQSTGFLVTTLVDKKERPSIDSVVGMMWGKLINLDYPLGFVFMQPYPVLKISTGGESTAKGAQYSYTITGPNEDDVYSCTNNLQAQMEKMPELVGIQTSVKLNMPQLEIELLRDLASVFNITATDIENTLSLAYSKGRVAQFTTDLDQYNVNVQLEDNYMMNPEDIRKLYVQSTITGKLVPFDNVANIKATLGPQQVSHSQQMISATISFNIASNIPLSVATGKVQKAAANILLPGMSGSFQGEAQEFQKAIASMTILVIIAVFLMYVILGILYESYIHPFTVLTTLPVAAFGGLGTLIIFNGELNLYAYVGLFMLLGIIAKNGIMMVDFASQNREKGEKMLSAIYNACLVRFRPILMTGLAAIMGALPIALGIGADGSSRQSLGLVIVGGLVFAQIITLFVTPGIYLYMEMVQEKFLDRFELSRSPSASKALESKIIEHKN
ncbi:MAG: efflux RND transporter permease subunit [Lentisphaerota bacterium]